MDSAHGTEGSNVGAALPEWVPPVPPRPQHEGPRGTLATQPWQAPVDPAAEPDPFQVVRYLNLQAGSVIADIPCGKGEFALEAAAKVLPKGRVAALDPDPANLSSLTEAARVAGVDNIAAGALPSAGRWPLPEAALDAAIISRFRYRFTPESGFIAELRRVLKPAGIALWVERAVPPGDDPPQKLRWEGRQDLVNALARHGFILMGTCDVGPNHYGLKFYCNRAPGEAVPSMPMSVR